MGGGSGGSSGPMGGSGGSSGGSGGSGGSSGPMGGSGGSSGPWVDPVGLAVLEEEVSWMPLEAAQVVLVDLLVPWAVLVGLLVVLVDHPVLWVVLVSLLVPWAALVAPVVQEEEVSWMPLAGVDLVREGFPLNTSCMYTLQAEDYTNQISNEENKTEYTYVEK